MNLEFIHRSSKMLTYNAFNFHQNIKGIVMTTFQPLEEKSSWFILCVQWQLAIQTNCCWDILVQNKLVDRNKIKSEFFNFSYLLAFTMLNHNELLRLIEVTSVCVFMCVRAVSAKHGPPASPSLPSPVLPLSSLWPGAGTHILWAFNSRYLSA